jgi:hypothetical protein
VSATLPANRRTLWLLVSVAAALFLGSLLFILSRVH